jgi:hypothetical protein
LPPIGVADLAVIQPGNLGTLEGGGERERNQRGIAAIDGKVTR